MPMLVSLVHLNIYHIYMHIFYISYLLCICVYIYIFYFNTKNSQQYVSSGLPMYHPGMSKRTLYIQRKQRRMFVPRLTLCTVVPIT